MRGQYVLIHTVKHFHCWNLRSTSVATILFQFTMTGGETLLLITGTAGAVLKSCLLLLESHHILLTVICSASWIGCLIVASRPSVLFRAPLMLVMPEKKSGACNSYYIWWQGHFCVAAYYWLWKSTCFQALPFMLDYKMCLVGTVDLEIFVVKNFWQQTFQTNIKHAQYISWYTPILVAKTDNGN